MNPFRITSQLVSARHRPAARPMRAAHEVPWRVVRRTGCGTIDLEHRGAAPVRAVRLALAGEGMLGLTLPRTLQPGETLRVALRGPVIDGVVTDPSAMLILRWFQPDGTELLWPISL